MPLTFAYAHLNLTRNPFGAPPEEERAALTVCDAIETMAHALRTGSARVIQLMGESGRGKSSHLKALHAHFPDAPWLYFPQDAPPPPLPPLSQTPFLFLDETQRLSWRQRQRLWRASTRVALATHQDHRGELFARRISFLHEEIGGLDAARLERILQRRLDWARRHPAQPIPSLSSTLIEGLLAHCGDDVRQMFGILYELVQRMPSAGPIPWPPPEDLPIQRPSFHRPMSAWRRTLHRHFPHEAQR